MKKSRNHHDDEYRALSLPNLSEAHETPEAFSRRVKPLEEEARRLLHAAQVERKAKLDPGRVDFKFAQGDLVLVLGPC